MADKKYVVAVVKEVLGSMVNVGLYHQFTHIADGDESVILRRTDKDGDYTETWLVEIVARKL